MRLVPARRTLLTAVLAAAAAGLIGVSPGSASGASPAQASSARAASVRARALGRMLLRYRAQSLGWRACIDREADPGLPAQYYRLQCGTLAAPLDWTNPDEHRQISIAVSRLPASTRPAKGALFTNPGGPGGAGLDLPLVLVDAGRTALTRSQDIYGMDVRGTGASSNVTCGGVGATLLDPRDRSAANLDLILDGAQLTARACHVAGGDLIDHVSTDQTVRDIDLLRSLVAAPRLNWLGYSAGTWLGAQYATAYPQHVGRMVLDSNVDFTGSWQDAFQLQPAGFERRFRADFLPWVARYAAVYKLGTSPAAVGASYERLRAGLRPDVPIDSAVTLDQLIAGSMYSKDQFALAASVLTELDGFLAARQGRNFRAASAAAARLRVASAQLQRTAIGRQPLASDASDAAFLAVTCNDGPWYGDRASLITGSARIGAASPLIGWQTLSEPCVFWSRPPVSTPVPTGAGVPAVLMVQSEHDPATPIEGARRAAARFAGARMLVVTGEGDHGIYAGGNPCVDRAVERFILTGALPAVGATCKGEPLPDPRSFTAQSRRARPTNPLLALRRLTNRLS